MSQADLARSFPSHWAPESTPCGWDCVCLAHDREHAQGLRDMRSESLRELDNVILVRAIGIPNELAIPTSVHDTGWGGLEGRSPSKKRFHPVFHLPLLR